MKTESLMTALPVSGVESQRLARLTGFFSEIDKKTSYSDITFLEPPASQHVPYVDPVKAMTVLLCAEDMDEKDAHDLAVKEFSILRPQLSLLQRPYLYHGIEVMNVPECVPVPTLVEFLRKRGLISKDFIEFLEKACDVTCRVRLFRMVDDWDKPIPLSEVPVPPPKAMIMFFVGLQTYIGEAIAPDDRWDPMPAALFAWRESMRPVAERLEKVLGEKVYHFQDFEDEHDDDCCHRFLALHCWCSLLPDSNFVEYLLEATGCNDVEELKATLIEPGNYTHPFTFNYAFGGIETVLCRFRYPLPGRKRRVGIAFRTEAAKERAREIALQQIGAEIYFLAPQDLAPDIWRREVAPYGHVYGIWSTFDEPIAFLANIDEIHVISDENRPGQGFDLKVGHELEVLMWRAYQLGVQLFSDEPAASVLSNPETCLKGCGVPERVAEIDAKRRSYTQSLRRLIVHAEYGSSGLWSKGGNIGYDLIDLPFPLIRRIAAWQRDHDDTLIPLLPEKTADDDWWNRHWKECKDIALAIQNHLGNEIDVCIPLPESLVPIKTL